MELIGIYFTSNYPTLMILLAVIILMIVNRNEKIPATQLFALVISMLLVITVGDTVSERAELAGNSPLLIRIHTISEVVKYILRPVIVMVELFIIIRPKKPKILYSIPAVINAFIFGAVMFGSRLAFYIDENNHWHSGTPLRYSVYISSVIYVILLLVHSIVYFRQSNIKRSIIVFLIVFQTLSVSILEYMNISGYVNVITALCILEYYIYLSTIYRQAIKDENSRREIDFANSELMILRDQLQAHFIRNSLGMIRYLAKHDSKACVRCIDEFSKYLNSHLNALQSNDMIPFEQEIENVRAYISLVQIDYTRKVEAEYDLGTTDFMIPPLLLEPIVENAISHGLSRTGGIISIRTYRENNNVIIIISNSAGSDSTPDNYKPLHNGIGLENTRKRLEIQCSGTLRLDITDSGAEVTVTIPQNAR